MVTLENVMGLMQTLNTGSNIGIKHFYCGTLDSKNDMSLGVYQLKRSTPQHIAIGGLGATAHDIKAVSLLIHGTHSSIETEQAAIALYNTLAGIDTRQTDINLGGHKVNCLILQQDEPIDVGQDAKGVFERVIEVLIYHNTAAT